MSVCLSFCLFVCLDACLSLSLALALALAISLSLSLSRARSFSLPSYALHVDKRVALVLHVDKVKFSTTTNRFSLARG